MFTLSLSLFLITFVINTGALDASGSAFTNVPLHACVHKHYVSRRRSSELFRPFAKTLQLFGVPNSVCALTGTSSNSVTAEADGTVYISPNEPLSQLDAVQVMDTIICPKNEFKERIGLGRDAQDISPGEIISNDDERNNLTYGEFPLESFDALIDRAIEIKEKMTQENGNDARAGKTKKLVDIGSGCGRLVLHAALTRGKSCNANERITSAAEEKAGNGGGYDVHGVEISDILHDYAVRSLQRGVDEGYFSSLSPGGDVGNWDDDQKVDAKKKSSISKVYLHLGAAEELTQVFADADIIFAYSTVWPATGFSVEHGAMVLGSSWSSMLADACKKGCIVITTDRILDTEFGWELVDRMDVENPDLLGSTGFIHVMKK